MNSKLLCLLQYVIELQLPNPLLSLHCGLVLFSMGFIFVMMLGSKENSHPFFSSIKSNNHNNPFTNIQNYATADHVGSPNCIQNL
jgi:hypothetical protein